MIELVPKSNKPVLNSVSEDNKFPWNIVDHKDTEFWLQKIGQHVILTGDIETNGTYYVRIVGNQGGRVFPALGHELIPSDSKEAKRINIKEQASGLFPINLSNWTQIKNFLCDDFINSYPWKATESKASEQIRDSWLSLAKSPRNGLSRSIENERMTGIFLDKTTFESRMKKHSESFPWAKMAEFLDFSEPTT